MALSRTKYKKLTDLYVSGRVVEFEDGTTLWLQALNQFEAHEAREAAQTARARKMLAIKSHDTEQLERVRAEFTILPRSTAVDQLVEREMTEALMKVVQAINADEDWTERLQIMSRSDEIIEREDPEDPERKLLNQYNREYLTEIQKRQDEEREFMRAEVSALDDEELEERWVTAYLDNLGSEAATREYRVAEIQQAARVCEGVRLEDDEWDHAACEDHWMLVYEDRATLKRERDAILDVLYEEMQNLNMSVQEAKGLGSPVSSSASSRLPNELGDLEPSTPEETPAEEPGTSESQSPTD